MLKNLYLGPKNDYLKQLTYTANMNKVLSELVLIYKTV